MTASDQLSEPTATDCKCLWCGRSIRYDSSFREMFFIDDVICSRCRQKLSARRQMFKVEGISIKGFYVYDGLVRDMLLQYKENCDEALFPVFLYPFIREMKRKYRGYTLVPVPSSNEMMDKRGFRHVNKMFSLLDLPTCDLIEKTDNVEQKKSSSRQEIGRHFRLKAELSAATEKILLADDIVTTGASMVSCYRLLKQKYAEISCLSVSYSRQFSRKLFIFTKN